MPIYQAWRIANDLQTLDRTVTLLDSSLVVIELKNAALNKADKTIAAQDSAYQAKANECKECRLYIDKSEALQKIELKREKVKGNKKAVAGFVVGVLIMLLL